VSGGLAARLAQNELRTKFRTDAALVETHNFQAAAFEGAIERENGNDDLPSRQQSSTEGFEVAAAGMLCGEEMEHRSVVPQCESMRPVKGGHVALEPSDLSRSWAESLQSQEDFMAQGGINVGKDGGILACRFG
jgi:hypothetical protein